MTSYDGSSEVIEDPTYGMVKFYIKYWSHPDYGMEFDWVELESGPCDPKDLNDVAGSNTESDFYKVNPKNEIDVLTYGPKLKCIREDYSIAGNFNTGIGANLMVVFERCVGNTSEGLPCKSPAEIEEWMRFKYIFTLENEVKFVQHLIDAESMVKQSVASWYSLVSVLRVDSVKMLKRISVNLQDEVYSVGELLANTDTGFVMEE